MSVALSEYQAVRPRAFDRPVGGRVAHRPHPRAVSVAPHPFPRPRRSVPPGLAVTAAAALLTAVVVMGLLGLAHLRAPAASSAPTSTAAVQVHSGETLSDVAARVAPGEPTGQVVRQIVDLNGMADSGVHAGQTLLVPVAAS